MIKRQRSGLVGLYVLSDVIAILVAFFWSYGFRFYGYVIPVDPEKGIPVLKSYILVFPIFLIIHIIIFYFQGFYKTRLKRTQIDDFIFVSFNTGITIIIVWGILLYLYSYSQGMAPLFRVTFKISHLFLPLYFFSVTLTVSFLRHQIYFMMKRRYARGMNLKNVLIIGAGEMGKTIAQKLSSYKDLGFVVKGFLDDKVEVGSEVDINGGFNIIGRINQLDSILEKGGISEVYVALELRNYSQILETLKTASNYIVNVRLIPDLFQMLTLKARIEDLDGLPVISIDEPPLRGIMLRLKKIVDILISVFSLVLLSPFLLLVAVFVKFSSKGPVLYHQESMGLDGKNRFGRFLRKFSIDEFPQLLNVLRGDMSLVGPRPERPVFVQSFRGKIPKYMLRHKVRSGVTGWAQVHGLRQDTDFDKRLEYDFYYIQNWSPSLDFKILWMTLSRGFIDKSYSKKRET